MEIFSINDVRKSFSTQTDVLCGMSLSVQKGEVVAIIGPSGSGKSTLLRCATLLETMDSGELVYEGIKAAWNGPAGNVVYAPEETLKKI
ncbi:MAG TPA: ATP-binding cassette domain-containing protein, partial [Flexilinea sp.]|nr:ATP-binding cassette domain-containing protein [Flexilinea sp.]HQG88655.1 ATP-binding cassette domain-containing protein [Flexilinea sp.]